MIYKLDNLCEQVVKVLGEEQWNSYVKPRKVRKYSGACSNKIFMMTSLPFTNSETTKFRVDQKNQDHHQQDIQVEIM